MTGTWKEIVAVNGDPDYTEHVAQMFMNDLGWSRKRRKKWLRRWGFKLTANLNWDNDPVEHWTLLDGGDW